MAGTHPWPGMCVILFIRRYELNGSHLATNHANNTTSILQYKLRGPAMMPASEIVMQQATKLTCCHHDFQFLGSF